MTAFVHRRPQAAALIGLFGIQVITVGALESGRTESRWWATVSCVVMSVLAIGMFAALRG